MFDFGAGVTVALCFDEDQERTFSSSQGSVTSFQKQQPAEQPREVHRPTITLGDVSARPFAQPVEGPPMKRLAQRVLSDYQRPGMAGKVFVVGTVVAMGAVLALLVTLLAPLFTYI